VEVGLGKCWLSDLFGRRVIDLDDSNPAPLDDPGGQDRLPGFEFSNFTCCQQATII